MSIVVIDLGHLAILINIHTRTAEMIVKVKDNRFIFLLCGYLVISGINMPDRLAVFNFVVLIDVVGSLPTTVENV